MAIELCKFRVENIIFEEPQKKHFANGSFHRIPIKYINEDGRKGELCIATNPLMSWGVQENRKKTASNVRDGPIEYYTLPLVVDDKETFETFDKIFTACRNHLKLPDVQLSMAKFKKISPDNMDPFYYKRDKTTGELVDGSDPTLYPKLLNVFQRIQNPDIPPIISSEFVDVEDNKINPLDLIGCRTRLIAAVTIKEIYVGSNPSIQIKVNDAIVIEKLEQSKRKLGSFFKNKLASTSSSTCVMNDIVDETLKPTVVQAPVVQTPVVKNRIVRRMD